MVIMEMEKESSKVCGTPYRGEVEMDLAMNPSHEARAHPPCLDEVVEVVGLTPRVHKAERNNTGRCTGP